jgi:hypothetical protein
LLKGGEPREENSRSPLLEAERRDWMGDSSQSAQNGWEGATRTGEQCVADGSWPSSSSSSSSLRSLGRKEEEAPRGGADCTTLRKPYSRVEKTDGAEEEVEELPLMVVVVVVVVVLVLVVVVSRFSGTDDTVDIMLLVFAE